MLFSLAEAIYSRILERRRRKFAAQPPQRVEGCRVVSVGNITVGGTGKTPMVQYLARELQRRGAKVAVVARGYRGSLSQQGAVVSDGSQILLTAKEAGDEPLLHARALPGIAVLIGRDRVAAARRAVTEFGADVLVLDDGFQFWSLARDFDIVLLDARRPFDNGYMLPKGRLREKPAALDRAQAVVLTRSDMATAEQRAITRTNVGKLTQAPDWEARHAPVALTDLNGAVTQLDLLENAPIGVFSALADNEAFARSLNGLGAKVLGTAFRSDHHYWRDEEILKFAETAKRAGAGFLVTTEKDIVKLAQRDFGLPIYSLRIEMSFLAGEETFLQLLSDTVL